MPLITRAAHYTTLKQQGLRLESPAETTVLAIPAVEHPDAVQWNEDDLVGATRKSQDTGDGGAGALQGSAVRDAGGLRAEHGVENERATLRWFPRVDSVAVMRPSSISTRVWPGVPGPVDGSARCRRWPQGTDDVAGALAVASASTPNSHAIPDIARWKYAKPRTNLGNATEAVCGPAARHCPIGELARVRARPACARPVSPSPASKKMRSVAAAC